MRGVIILEADDLKSILDSPLFSHRRQIDLTCRQFEDAWHSKERRTIEWFLESSDSTIRTSLAEELIACEWELRHGAGETPELSEYVSRFPEHAELLQMLASGADEEGSRTANAPATFEPHRLRPGDVFAGYQIVGCLGAGGMGTVYEAKLPSIGQTVALKILDRHPTRRDEASARFEQEARLLSKLDHPGIVPLFGYGEESGCRFLAMKLIRGVSLADVLTSDPDRLVETCSCHRDTDREQLRQVIEKIRNRGAGGRTELLLKITNQLSEALQAVHSAGILHRDIKPSNVLLSCDGIAYLTDFGLAKDQSHDVKLTTGGEFLGTPRYAAPETLDGRYSPQSDLYSLGLVLFELFSLRTPFSDRSVRSLLKSKISGQIPELSPDGWAPHSMESAIRSLLRESPEERTQSAKDFVAKIAATAAGYVPRNRLKVSLIKVSILLAAVSVMGMAGLSAFRGHETERPASTESNVTSESPSDFAGTIHRPEETEGSAYTLDSNLKLLSELRLPSLAITEHLAFSDDGSAMLVTTRDRRVFLGDLTLRELKEQNTRLKTPIRAAGISSSGKYAFLLRDHTAADDQTAGEPDRNNRKQLESWSIREDAWRMIEDKDFLVARDQPHFVFGGPRHFPQMLLIPDLTDPTLYYADTGGYPVLEFPSGERTAIAAYLFTTAVATPDGQVKLLYDSHETPDGVREEKIIPAELQDVEILRFSPDGKLLIAINRNEVGLIRISDWSFLRSEHSCIGEDLQFSFSSDNTILVVWSSKSICLFALPGLVRTASWESPETLVGVGIIGGSGHVLTAERSGRVCTLVPQNGGVTCLSDTRGPRLLGAAFTPTKNQLALATAEGKIEILEVIPQ